MKQDQIEKAQKLINNLNFKEPENENPTELINYFEENKNKIALRFQNQKQIFSTMEQLITNSSHYEKPKVNIILKFFLEEKWFK